MDLSNYCDICGETSEELISLFKGERTAAAKRREVPLAQVCPRCLTYDLVRAVASHGLEGVLRYAEDQRVSA